MCYRPMHSRNLRYFIQPITQFCDRFPCFASQDRAHHTAHNIIHGICNVQRSSWYTDDISHEFHKNGKTYQNTDSMSLLEMKQLFMWLLQKIVKITGKWISRSIFWEKHVRLHAASHIVNSHRTGMHCIVRPKFVFCYVALTRPKFENWVGRSIFFFIFFFTYRERVEFSNIFFKSF